MIRLAQTELSRPALKLQVHVPFHWSIARPSPASTCLYNMNCDLSLSSSDSGDCSLRVHAQPWLMLRRRRNCFNGLQVSSQQSAPTWSLGRSSAAAITQDSKISEMRTFPAKETRHKQLLKDRLETFVVRSLSQCSCSFAKSDLFGTLMRSETRHAGAKFQAECWQAAGARQRIGGPVVCLIRVGVL